MNFNFELLLTLAVFITGFIVLFDIIFFVHKRQLTNAKMPILIEYARSFFPILLIVLLLRSFLIEPFRIPTGSDKPTLLVGDFIAANKFIYGLRLPVTHTKIFATKEPQTGDIALLRYPIDPSMNFIKRVIGKPGDRISYINKILYINGKSATQQSIGQTTDIDAAGQSWAVEIKQEDLAGVKHLIYTRPDIPASDFSVTVPANQYFVMGDNRDDSNDSRYWGFVPEENLVGKALLIWLSWSGEKPYYIRWQRLGNLIH